MVKNISFKSITDLGKIKLMEYPTKLINASGINIMSSSNINVNINTNTNNNNTDCHTDYHTVIDDDDKIIDNINISYKMSQINNTNANINTNTNNDANNTDFLLILKNILMTTLQNNLLIK